MLELKCILSKDELLLNVRYVYVASFADEPIESFFSLLINLCLWLNVRSDFEKRRFDKHSCNQLELGIQFIVSLNLLYRLLYKFAFTSVTLLGLSFQCSETL